jgi:release factor glutamine methyltransferase
LEQAGIETARLDAQCLLAAVLGRPRWQVLLEPKRRLSAEEFGQMLRSLQRREGREPLAYILGAREFWSLPFAVSPDVLVPRPETETLVEAALAAWTEMTSTAINPQSPAPVVVDLCTGSGAVAIVLATEIPTARVLATDVSWRALRAARANALRHGVAERITFLRGDLWGAVNGQAPEGSVDLVVANPPYVPTHELATLMPEVQWEPRLALDGGTDGLRVIREIVATSPDRIRPGGFLLLEIGADQAKVVQAFVAASGRWQPPRLWRDLAGRPRVVAARRLAM